jgi:regulation of enolase protein 1 (concanavalin A-like superfamily)
MFTYLFVDSTNQENAPFYYKNVKGDFEFIASYSANYNVQYDQAGIALRVNSDLWLKAGIYFKVIILFDVGVELDDGQLQVLDYESQ